MLRQKIFWTLAVTGFVIASAVVLDYVLNVLFLKEAAGFTPLVTLTISGVVGAPVAFVVINATLDIRRARDALAIAHSSAEESRAVAQSALREAEKSRQVALSDRQRALEASRAKSEFLANMSHELRTPLNAILGFSEMLKNDIRRDRTPEYARIIHTSGRHLLSLINDILDLSKIEAGKYELRREHVLIQDLIRDCVTLVQPAAEAAGIAMNVAMPHALFVHADERALRQIVLNLLTNALKFTKRGGSVGVGASITPSGEFCLEIADTGVGIAQEDLLRVFESFGQGRHDVVDANQGTGLGLPIVRGLAEAQGGRVELESSVGKGTTVKVYLPMRRQGDLARQVA